MANKLGEQNENQQKISTHRNKVSLAHLQFSTGLRGGGSGHAKWVQTSNRGPG